MAAPGTPSGASSTIAARLAEDIARRIISGGYAPGSNLRGIALAETFHVSRKSIRQATRTLEKVGVVRIEPRRGASVTRLKTDELVEVYQVRASLLGLAMSMFCSVCTEDQLRWLEARYHDMQSIKVDDQKEAAARHAQISA